LSNEVYEINKGVSVFVEAHPFDVFEPAISSLLIAGYRCFARKVWFGCVRQSERLQFLYGNCVLLGFKKKKASKALSFYFCSKVGEGQAYRRNKLFEKKEMFDSSKGGVELLYFTIKTAQDLKEFAEDPLFFQGLKESSDALWECSTVARENRSNSWPAKGYSLLETSVTSSTEVTDDLIVLHEDKILPFLEEGQKKHYSSFKYERNPKIERKLSKFTGGLAWLVDLTSMNFMENVLQKDLLRFIM
jgi:hypothetical protein